MAAGDLHPARTWWTINTIWERPKEALAGTIIVLIGCARLPLLEASEPQGSCLTLQRSCCY